MYYLMTKTFWRAALIRALRTFAQAAIGAIGAAAMLSEVNWAAVGSASALAAILSLLTSIATNLPEATEGKITFINNEDDGV